MKQGKGGGKGKGHSAKHAGTGKHVHGQHPKHHQKAQHKKTTHHHTTTAGHKVHVVAKGQKGHKARGLALGQELAVCAAEALAASLRLTGRPVSDADVAALYERSECAGDAGTCVQCALEAASRHGLAGVRPGSFGQVGQVAAGTLMILGLELPGSHTVLATPAGWWSWGRLYCPCEWPGATVEEAWWVQWQ